MTQSSPCPVPVTTEECPDPLELLELVTEELEPPEPPDCTVTDDPPGIRVVLDRPFCPGIRTVLDIAPESEERVVPEDSPAPEVAPLEALLFEDCGSTIRQSSLMSCSPRPDWVTTVAPPEPEVPAVAVLFTTPP